MKNGIFGFLLGMATCVTGYGQGTKLSSFPVATSVDTGNMKFVIVCNSGGSYVDKQLSMGQFAAYLNGTSGSAFGAGYGLTYSGMIFKLDSANVFPSSLSTLAAGYGLNYAGRTYKVDTGTIFPKVTGSIAAGYGLLYSSRTYKEDTGTTFPRLISSMAAGYGLIYSSRTYKADTGTTFPAVRTSIAAVYGPQNISATSYITSVTISSTVAVETSNVNYDISSQAGDLLFNNPTGSWANHQILIISVKDNGTGRNLTYGSNFADCLNPPISKQAATVVGQTLEQEYRFHSSDGKFYLEGQTSH